MEPEKVTSPSVLMGCREQDVSSVSHAWPRIPEDPGGVRVPHFSCQAPSVSSVPLGDREMERPLKGT